MDERMGRIVNNEAAHLSAELNMNHEHQAADLLRADARFGPEAVKAIAYQAMAMSAPQSDHILLNGARDGGVDIAIQHQRHGFPDSRQLFPEAPKPILHVTPPTQYAPETVVVFAPVDQHFAPPGAFVQPSPGYMEPPPAPQPNNEAACTAGGAVVGGVLGNVLGNRHDRPATTILGAITGAVVGNRACENR